MIKIGRRTLTGPNVALDNEHLDTLRNNLDISPDDSPVSDTTVPVWKAEDIMGAEKALIICFRPSVSRTASAIGAQNVEKLGQAGGSEQVDIRENEISFRTPRTWNKMDWERTDEVNWAMVKGRALVGVNDNDLPFHTTHIEKMGTASVRGHSPVSDLDNIDEIVEDALEELESDLHRSNNGL